MKKTSKAVKISVLTSVSALALFGGAFVSGASATETATPTATASTSTTVNPLDVAVTSDDEVQALIGDNQDEQDFLNVQIDAQNADQNVQEENDNVDVQENDSQLDELNAEDQAENDSFNQDIAQAEQSGNNEDAAQLKVDASIVTGVNDQEIKAVAADDTEAHVIITGVPAK